MHEGGAADELPQCEATLPGMYRSMCVELTLHGLCVNTVLESKHVHTLDGGDPGCTRWPGRAAHPYPSSRQRRTQGAAAARDTQGSGPGRQQASGGLRPPRLGPAELPFSALCEV